MKVLGFPGRKAGFVVVAAFLLAPGRGVAVDGVIEINQTRALAGGVSTGDNPGFPVTIDQSGSYRLTGDLSVSDPDDDGIRIESNSVTLDLNGFVVGGPGQGVGSGDGITAASGGNVSIRNGTIQDFPGDGIGIGFGAFIDRVRALTNGNNGIRVNGAGSQVTNCVASSNLDDGILVGPRSVISGNTAVANGGNGINADDACTVTGNAVSSNGANGIRTIGRAVVKDNTAYDNDVDGIYVGTGVAVNNMSSNNRGDGIEFNGSGSAIGNSVLFNTGYGLRMTNATGYSANSALGNTAGQKLSGIQLGQNLCQTSLCP